MEGTAARDDLIQIAVDAMSNVHDMDVPWRVYAAAVVDALIEDGAIPVWQAIDKAPTDSTILLWLTDGTKRWVGDCSWKVWTDRSGVEHRATHFIIIPALSREAE